MQIEWDASEIKIRLVPVGRPIGRKTCTASVFKEYGDVKVRFVQAIADMLDGETVYFEAIDADGNMLQTIPVTGWRNGSMADAITYAALFLERALAKNVRIVCYGASRAKFALDLEMAKMVTDNLDNMSDKGLYGKSGKTRSMETIEANGIRTEF